MTEPTMDLEVLRGWIGRAEVAEDAIPARTVRLVQAFFDLEASARDGDPLPPCWHWCFFHQPVPRIGLGADGHHKVGGFLPAFALPRRMWGGSQIVVERPILVGHPTRKVSTVRSVDIKQGSSGTLGLVRVEHVVSQGDETCLTELQDLVYREPQSPTSPAASAPVRSSGAAEPLASDAAEEVIPNEVTLFRYSALTYNAHRIHYDRDYAVREEGYPDLVVHGPFTASRLALFATSRMDKAPMREFSFRGTRPLFCGEAFSIHARKQADELELWARNGRGEIAMQARAVF